MLVPVCKHTTGLYNIYTFYIPTTHYYHYYYHYYFTRAENMFYYMKSYPLMLVRMLELRLTPLSLPCVWAAGVLSLCVSLRPSGRRAPPRMLLLLFIWLPRYKSRVSLKRHSVLINETAGERRRGCRWREGAASGGHLHHQPAGRRRFISPPRGCESGCNLTPHACRKTSNTPPPPLSLLRLMDCQCVTVVLPAPFLPQTRRCLLASYLGCDVGCKNAALRSSVLLHTWTV